MKGTTKRIVLGILGLFLSLALAAALYFYLVFSGNPIERWQAKAAVRKFYEDRYPEEFKVLYWDYDWKRHEFEFVLSPAGKPALEFTATSEATSRSDNYGGARSREYLYTVIDEALGTEFEYLNYRVNVYESYDSPGRMETDLARRLSENEYVLDFTWDTVKIKEAEIDAVLEAVAKRIEGRLDPPVGSLIIRASVYGGTNWYLPDKTVIR